MDRIVELVTSGGFDPVKELTGNKEKFLEMTTKFESISANLPKEACTKLVATKIIPQIFNKNVDNVLRDRMTEIGLHLLQSVDILILNAKEQEEILSKIEDTYVTMIGEFRDNNYVNWDKLWIFVIKFCSYKIHSKMSLANKLLRVVEVAFRNSTSIEQRLKAYDCWIELINNSSLNMDHMCSVKQIKLLMTPMKAKFSRMPIVILKRCDTFVYLLEKLGEKATLCLKEFLEFCFGPFDEKNDGKMKQGRSVSEVCNKSTRVLLEILGHSHKDGENCLANDDLNLHKPFITKENFPNFADILINSVVECYILLNDWSQNLRYNNIIIKCLWRSLLQFIHNSNDDVKKKCRTQINNALKKLLEKSRSNDSLHWVLGNIVTVTIQDEMGAHLKETIFDVSLNISFPLSNSSFDLEVIQNFVVSSLDPETSNLNKITCNYLKTNIKSVNAILCESWLKCKLTVMPDDISMIIWPIRHFRSFTDVEAVKSKWTKSYTSECKTDSLKIIVLREMEKLFLENPLLSSNIVVFLVLISSEETNPSRDFVSKFMRLIELVLSLPNISDQDVHKIRTLVLTYCNQNHNFYKSDNNEEALDKLCVCLERLVTIHKDYRILVELPNRLKNSNPKNLARFSKRLMTVLKSVTLSEDTITANSTRKLIELLETKENEPETTSSSRSLRLINLANSSKTKRLSGQKVSSPLSIKSTPVSTPKNKTVDKKKKDVLNQDNSSDYVKVDTQVRINVDNLSEHQKEMFKKRREDIPALYEDLTQSQSQDFFSTIKSVSEAAKNEKSPKKRKRSDQDETEHASKIPKTEDEYIAIADTQTIPTLDSDLTQILDVIPQVDKVPPENLFQETPKPAGESKNNVNGEGKTKSPEKKKVVHSEETSEKLKSPEKKKVVNSEETSEKLKTPEKKKICPESPSRRSPRHAQKPETLDSVVKELDELLTVALKTDKPTQPTAENKTLENGSHEEKAAEKPLRKSERKVKKRHSDFVFTLQKKTPDGKTKANSSLVLPSSLDQDQVNTVRKKKKKEKRNSKDSDEANSDESMSSLLARVDKRIEDRKNLEKQQEDSSKVLSQDDNQNLEKQEAEVSLQDGNQNQIMPQNEELKIKIDTKSQSVKKPTLPTTPEVSKSPDTESTTDVYQFKATESSPEVAKKRKNRKKKLVFCRSDYNKKRRRRPKIEKDSEDKSFLFHVTADSPVPLSRSPSLRAVRSPDKSETITILITRSPPDSSKENQDANKSASTPASRRSKRRASQNSEDIIESSQEPEALETSRRKSKDKSRSLKQTTIDDMIKPLEKLPVPVSNNEEVEDTPLETISGDLFSEKENDRTKPISRNRRLSYTETSQNITSGKRVKRSKSLDKIHFTPGNITWSLKPKLDENHINTGETAATEPKDNADTKQTQETQEICSLSPKNATTLTLSPSSATKDDLPGSPILCDTPDRTIEFLNSTSDISPISMALEESVPTPKPTNEVSNVRVARLLQMVNSNVQVSNEGRRWFGSKHSSPRSSRVRKMRMKKEDNLDILTFSREIPSPLTLPTTGILKRKLDEVATPSPKRKRVNFSDPATTEKKVFIKDSEEFDDVRSLTNGSVHTEELCFQKPEEFNREEAISSFRDFCDSFKDGSEVRNTLTRLKQTPELEEIAEYLDSQELEDTQTQEEFLPKLLSIPEKLSDDQLQHLINGISKVSSNDARSELTQQEVENYIVKLDCDKMNDVIKTYCANLESKDRNDFLVSLMSLASNELPVNKEFINCHLNLVQSFVNKMN